MNRTVLSSLVVPGTLIAASASAGECIAYRATPERPKAPETLIVAKKVTIRHAEQERRFISNDESVILTLRRVQSESGKTTAPAAAVFVSLAVDGKDLLVSEATSDGNTVFTRASAVAANGNTYGVNCLSIDY